MTRTATLARCAAAAADTAQFPAANSPVDGMPSEKAPAIEIAGVEHWFGEGEARKQALRNNNLILRKGEVVVMGGPSGSGKTTMLTLIGGLRKVQEGSLRVTGKELRNASEQKLIRHRRHIGFIFQAHNLFESLTAFQNVKMATDLTQLPHAQAGPRIENLLTQLGLGHRIHYKPQQLSGGQKQRVAIARALVNSPRLILADEPTAALDATSGRIVVDMLKELATEHGSTVLIVTHDARILDRADRIVTMEDGEIVSDVAVEETAAVMRFLHDVPIFAELPTGTLFGVAEKMKRVTIPEGRLIFRQGDAAELFYLIRGGTAEVWVREDTRPTGGNGTSHADISNPVPEDLGQKVATLGPGEVFGERALLTGDSRSASLVSAGPGPLVAYQLSKASFQQALSASESLDEQLRKLSFLRVPHPGH